MYSSSSFPGGSEGEVSACNAGDLGLFPGSGRSPGEGNGNPLQYCCLENPMDGEAWSATVHGFAKSRTQLSDFTHSLIRYYKQHCLHTFLYMPLALGHHFLQDVFIRMKYLIVFKTYISPGTSKI